MSASECYWGSRKESFSTFFATPSIGTRVLVLGSWTEPYPKSTPVLHSPEEPGECLGICSAVRSQPNMSHFLPFHKFSLGEFLSTPKTEVCYPAGENKIKQSRCNNVTPEGHQSQLTPAA